MRAWSVSAWRHGDRAVAARGTLAALAGLAAAGDGRARPAVPDVGLVALTDQLAVLAADALTAGAPAAAVDELFRALAAELGFRPNR